MNGKNFSPGDWVVVVVEPKTPYFKRGGLYCVSDAGFSCIGDPGVELHGRPAARYTDHGPEFDGWCDCGCFIGWSSTSFRLAFKPDPEVERERVEDPIKRPESA